MLKVIDGVTLIRRVVDRAADTGHPVFVTLPVETTARRDALDGTTAKLIEVEDAEAGMSASFRAYMRAVGTPTATLCLPADMPDLTTEDLMQVIDAFLRSEQERVCRAATADGRAGHPVLFTSKLVARFAELEGDAGARSLVPDDTLLVSLPGTRALTDLDTPEVWAAWEAARTTI